jgi:hypothetical protein
MVIGGSNVNLSLTQTLPSDVVGLLGRNITVTLCEIGRGGCLIETTSPILPGAVGRLTVTIGAVPYTEDVRVTRCLTVAGRGETHHIGLEFLPLHHPGRRSLRMYAASRGEELQGPASAVLG